MLDVQCYVIPRRSCRGCLSRRLGRMDIVLSHLPRRVLVEVYQVIAWHLAILGKTTRSLDLPC